MNEAREAAWSLLQAICDKNVNREEVGVRLRVALDTAQAEREMLAARHGSPGVDVLAVIGGLADTEAVELMVTLVDRLRRAEEQLQFLDEEYDGWVTEGLLL